jgi:ribosomal protein S18 acetylase RimI-like enzyme
VTVTVRRRELDDVPEVAKLIMRQQPVTRYPFRNPLPFPVEEFVVRRGELAAWVVEVSTGSTSKSRVVGHVSVLDVTDHPVGPEWSAAAGRPVEDLAAVSVLVVDLDLGRRGVGSALMDACEAYLEEIGRTPVLEVVADAQSRALGLYLKRGWRVVGEVKPHWLPEGEGPVKIMVLPPAGPPSDEQAT